MSEKHVNLLREEQEDAYRRDERRTNENIYDTLKVSLSRIQSEIRVGQRTVIVLVNVGERTRSCLCKSDVPHEMAQRGNSSSDRESALGQRIKQGQYFVYAHFAPQEDRQDLHTVQPRSAVDTQV